LNRDRKEARRSKGAGRKPGSRNKATMMRESFKQAVSKEAMDAGMLPVDFMLSMMRNEEMSIDTRFQAAKEAAPYVHPKAQMVAESKDPPGYDALKELVLYVNGRTRRLISSG
jgi:hypothetical protein